jgi:hypothetical protein
VLGWRILDVVFEDDATRHNGVYKMYNYICRWSNAARSPEVIILSWVLVIRATASF